jgi:hypothetical protein
MPRVIFAMGSIVFIAEVIHENWCMATFGASIVFASLAVNSLLKMMDTGIWKGLTIMQGVFSLLLSAGLSWYAFHLCASTRHGVFIHSGRF